LKCLREKEGELLPALGRHGATVEFEVEARIVDLHHVIADDLEGALRLGEFQRERAHLLRGLLEAEGDDLGVDHGLTSWEIEPRLPMLSFKGQLSTAALLMRKNPWLNHDDAMRLALQQSGQGVGDEKGRILMRLDEQKFWLENDFTLVEARPEEVAAA